MKVNLNNRTKIALVVICFVASVTGFLIKLPSAFRHIDKELHFAYYFLAAGFLNVLFNIKNLLKHIFVAALLYAFGVGIEFAQENYNKVFHVRFHGRYDPEDVKANLTGIVSFSILWLLVMAIRALVKPTRQSN